MELYIWHLDRSITPEVKSNVQKSRELVYVQRVRRSIILKSKSHRRGLDWRILQIFCN